MCGSSRPRPSRCAVAAIFVAALWVAPLAGASRLDEDIENDQPIAASYPPQVEFEQVGHPDEPMVSTAPMKTPGVDAQQLVAKPEADARKSEAKPRGHTVRGEVLKSLKQLHTVHRLVDDTEALATSLSKALKKEVSHLKAENSALKRQLKAADEENKQLEEVTTETPKIADGQKKEAMRAKSGRQAYDADTAVVDGQKKAARRGKAGVVEKKALADEAGESEKEASGSDSSVEGDQKEEARGGEVGAIEKKAIGEAGEVEKKANSVVAKMEKEEHGSVVEGEKKDHATVADSEDQASDGQEQKPAEHRSRATRRATPARHSRQSAARLQAEKQAAAKEARIAAGEEQAAKAAEKAAKKEESQAKEVFNFVSKF